MSTEYTAVTTIVVLESIRQEAEQAAIAADPEGGAGTFVPGTPLRAVGDSTNTPVAYWCRWNMKPGQMAAFAQNMGGPLQVLNPGQQPNMSRDRWMFDSSEGWSPQEVLTALNFEPRPSIG